MFRLTPGPILRYWSSWALALSATVLLGLVGLSYILTLLIFPSSVDTISWPVLDKRWIIALFALGVALVYFPLGMKRIIDLFRDRNIPAFTRDSVRTNKIHFLGRCAVALSIGFALAALHTGAYVPLALHRFLDYHEVMQLGPILSIAQGAVPYVGAQTIFGPGHQVIIFEFMHNIEFTLRGFRVSFFLMNIIAETIAFTLMFLGLGWTAGLVGVGLSFIFYSDSVMTFFGWFNLFRWLGPLVVGILLPSIVWSELPRSRQNLQIAILGIACGTVGWISQENFLTVLVTASLIVLVGFGRGRLSVTEAIYSFATFVTFHLLTFLVLLTLTVGVENLLGALFLCFHTGSFVMQGLTNTPWTSLTSTHSPYTNAFYLTPYVVIAITGMALYSRPQQELKDERWVGIIVGTAAAVASLVPITLMRSDDYHFLGPATGGLPALIALSVMLLPGVLTKNVCSREATRCALLIILCAIYLAPHGGQYIVARLTPDISEAWRGLSELGVILARSSPPIHSAAILDQRLGWQPDAGAKCMNDIDMTCQELRDRMQEIRAKVGERSVYVASTTVGSILDSAIYFFADLNVGTLAPSIRVLVRVRGDLARLKASLAKKPPECVVSADRNGFGDLAVFLLRVYQTYTTDSIRDGFVFCRRTAESST
jgi:hypothetical protein